MFGVFGVFGTAIFPLTIWDFCEFEGFSVSYYMLEFGQNQIPDKNQQQAREKKNGNE